MLGEPVLNDGMFVRRVVVCNQMQRLVLGCLTINPLQELQPFDVVMLLLAVADDSPSLANFTETPLHVGFFYI